MYHHDVCVAKPLALEASGEIFGAPFMLVERRPGRTIGHMFDLPKKPNTETSRDIAEKLAAIHRVPIGDMGDWIPGADVSTAAQVAVTLEHSYSSWQALQRPSPLYEAAFKWLRENVSVMDRSRGLVHGDYGLNNLLIERGRVSVVLDWEFAHVGNPAYDLGYFYYQAKSLSSWQEFLDAYHEAGGTLLSTAEIDYSVLFAATRVGVMVCQAEAAYLSGAANGLFMALVPGRNNHNVSLSRLSDLLERVL
jgi:aminoglycoside phosphotransferase (APT) family kinase protein